MRRVGGGLIWGLTFWVGRGGDQDLGAARDSEFRGWWFWGHQFWDSAVLSSGSLQFVLWALFYDRCSEVQVYNGRWELATVCFRNIFVKYGPGPPLQLKYVQNSPNIWCHNLDTIRCHIQQSTKFDSYPGRAGGAQQREARTKPCPSPPPASFLHPPNIFHTSDARSSVPHIKIMRQKSDDMIKSPSSSLIRKGKFCTEVETPLPDPQVLLLVALALPLGNLQRGKIKTPNFLHI